MLGSYGIRTDLALEATERFTEENVEIRGVEISEDYDEEKDVRTTVVKITTENGARTMGRPQGNYITIEAPGLSMSDEDYHREISEKLALHLKKLIHLEREQSILVVGLGNSAITADSLGPHVVDNLYITRHMIREYGLKSMGKERMHRVSGIIPGVMAQTGMETSEIVQGIVAETKPDVVIAIDALAARSTRRLNRTIQITDTGINPGSGVGNHRVGLTEENLQVKVIGIGVPTVVDAATIVRDSMAHLLDALEETEQKEFLEEMISPHLHTMFVTPRDVDETVKYLSYTISEGLNIAFSQQPESPRESEQRR
ncbi:GPR endopeptidase [Blautia luti]|jgi:spore protease|uniref:Germination protease n=1 Tax=Blautia luti DSM 14534 = JCM 17040 TaxID=649762 RepID=A0A844GLH2_9FIRM|nr:GPR endopeptidase [Blautia luti]MTD61550.1 GPR endopeptidase [Blautia luti DSM 14534 = JCM 17040]BEI59373.1 GPR endopeptidase [Blautia luti]